MDLINVGEKAPGFRLEGSDGETYDLEEVLEASRVMLVFYPANNTPG
jgi:peroxiredoxin